MQNAADLVTAQLLRSSLKLQGLGKVARSILIESAKHAVAFTITDNVTAALKSDDFWVLVEDQPWDADAKKGIVFNLQLQQAIVMYYLCRDKTVRVLSASERYKFLGIKSWQQMTRHVRKVSTANAVRQLLEAGDGNAFAGRNHNLRVWQAA
jgi:hypothetical protein